MQIIAARDKIAAIAVVLLHALTITTGAQTLQPLQALTGYPLGAYAVQYFHAVWTFSRS